MRCEEPARALEKGLCPGFCGNSFEDRPLDGGRGGFILDSSHNGHAQDVMRRFVARPSLQGKMDGTLLGEDLARVGTRAQQSVEVALLFRVIPLFEAIEQRLQIIGR